jgi:hypothetical protein
MLKMTILPYEFSKEIAAIKIKKMSKYSYIRVFRVYVTDIRFVYA